MGSRFEALVDASSYWRRLSAVPSCSVGVWKLVRCALRLLLWYCQRSSAGGVPAGTGCPCPCWGRLQVTVLMTSFPPTRASLACRWATGMCRVVFKHKADHAFGQIMTNRRISRLKRFRHSRHVSDRLDRICASFVKASIVSQYPVTHVQLIPAKRTSWCTIRFG